MLKVTLRKWFIEMLYKANDSNLFLWYIKARTLTRILGLCFIIP